MKVLVFHNLYRSANPSGENTAVLQDVELLRAAGHEVALAEKRSDDVLAGGRSAQLAAAASAVYSVGSRREAVELARSTRADVAHLHNLYPLWSPSIADGLAEAGVPRVHVLHNYRLSCIAGSHMLAGAPCTRCLGTRVPLAGTLHRCYGSASGSATMTLSHTVNRRRLLTGDWYLAVSDVVRTRAVQHGVPQARISLKPEWLPADAAVADRSGGDHAPYLAFAGRLDAVKGVRLLVDAFRRYRQAGGAAELRVAGAGPMAAWLAEQADRTPGLHVLGRLEPAATRALMAGARAVVAPGLWEEPFGLIVLEAWREGRPVVVTDVGGPAELVDGGTGWVVPADPVALQRALAAAADDPAEADRRGAAGRERVRRDFSGAATLAAYEHAWQGARIGDAARIDGHAAARTRPAVRRG